MVGVCLKIVINIISIDKIYVGVLCTDNALCYEGVTFEEAGKMEWYDAAILNRAIMNQRPYYDIYTTTNGANGIFGVITPESLREYFLWKEKNDKIWKRQNLK